MREVRDHTSESIIIYLVGNFADMQDEREVSYEEALNFAREENFGHYVETSAKTGQNVQELF